MSDVKANAKAIFLEALERQGREELPRFLDEACGGDAALRARVEELLRAHHEAGSFLEPPAPSPVATVEEAPVTERPGTVIGPYKLLQQIGEGGMGVVWMAEQTQPVQRKVALKVIKPGMDSRQVIARFEAERQALALMDHVNIARVFDGGTTENGRPYFVMELVHGVPITKYCDDNRLTPRERLELFVPVCQALQHAHQKGIIHRDVKPSNVMITLYDGKPVPKVIDFGVAKATEQRLTERTLFTQYGTMVGTLEYMSPEQAEMSALGADTRSDIYSLGVLLYELLTGSTPLTHKRLKEAAYAEVLRMIKEEEPPRPSTRLSDSGEALASISANRHMEPAKLTKLVRGELDWIVMKCLEKDRNRRYETANGFAMDVQRYLADEPVLACPPSVGYRFRKFSRRNKVPVLAGSIILLLLVAGVVGTSIGLVRAEQRAEGERQAKEEAQKRLTQIEKGTEILASVFRDVDPRAEAKEGVTLRVLLGRRLGEAAQQLEGEAVGDPLVVTRLQHLLGISLRELGHQEQAEVVLVKARQTRDRLLGADHLDTASTKHNLAGVCRDRGKHAQAEQLYKEVLEVRSAQLGHDHTDTLSSKNNLALLYMDQRQLDLAEPLLREVLQIRIAKLGADDPKTLQSKNNLSGLYDLQGKYAEAEPLLKEVLDIRAAKLGLGHFDTLQSRNNLAALYERQGKLDLAETMHKEVLEISSAELGSRHSITLVSKQNLAVVYSKQEKYALAETLVKEVLEVHTTMLPADHPRVLSNKASLAALYRHMKKFDQSIPLLEEILKLERTKFRPDHPETLDTQARLGVVYREAGQTADAIPLLEEVHQKGRKYPKLAWVGNALLTAYVQAGKKAEATALVTAQVEAARKQFSADSLQLSAALADIGKALLDAKAYADAELLLRESLSIRKKNVPDAWETQEASSVLGEALLGLKRYADAEPLLLAGYEGMKKQEAKISLQGRSNLTKALERLVQLYDAWSKPDEAAKWRKELEAFAKATEQPVKPKGK